MKEYKLISVILVFIALAVSGCKNANAKNKFNLEEAKVLIEAKGKVYAEALNKKDSVGLANCYTNDAKFMQPNAKSVVWRANIQKLFGQWMKADMPKFSMKTIEIWGNREVLAAEEEWAFTDKDGKVVDSGKALEIFKKEDGIWKLYRDCYNSDFPCPK